jgi:hypothetical protein
VLTLTVTLKRKAVGDLRTADCATSTNVKARVLHWKTRTRCGGAAMTALKTQVSWYSVSVTINRYLTAPLSLLDYMLEMEGRVMLFRQQSIHHHQQLPHAITLTNLHACVSIVGQSVKKNFNGMEHNVHRYDS